MSFARQSRSGQGSTTEDRSAAAGRWPRKRTLVEQTYGSSPVQRIVTAGSNAPAARVRAEAEAGTRLGGGSLPHLDAIQRRFGRHDVRGVRAHTDAAAAAASRSMGAEAFATGEHVAFSAPPTLRVAAHEAAHVVQQRAGVQASGGVGEAGAFSTCTRWIPRRSNTSATASRSSRTTPSGACCRSSRCCSHGPAVSRTSRASSTTTAAASGPRPPCS